MSLLDKEHRCRLLYYYEYCKLSINKQIEYDLWLHISNQEKRYIDSN